MREEHARLLLLPMMRPFYDAAMSGWSDHLWLLGQNDRFALRPTTQGGTLHDAISDHLARNVAASVDPELFGKKELNNFVIYIAREQCGYRGHLAVKVNSTGSDFRLSKPDTDAAERRQWQRPMDLPLFGIFEDVVVDEPGKIGTWVTAAYCADSKLTYPPALAFSCQRGDETLWTIRVDESVVIETDHFLTENRTEYRSRLTALQRRVEGA